MFSLGRDALDIKSETLSAAAAAAADPVRESCTNTHRYYPQVYTLFSNSVRQRNETRFRRDLEQMIDFKLVLFPCCIYVQWIAQLYIHLKVRSYKGVEQ